MDPYRGMTRAELDAQYRVTAVIRDPKAIVARMTEASAAFRADHAGISDVAFGEAAGESLDLFFPVRGGGAAPVHLFVHGGYWYQFPKMHWSFVARGLVERGMLVAVCDYALCPAASITEIARQVRGAVAWLFRNVARHGGDPSQIHLSGHSAGAQLAILAALRPHPDATATPCEMVRSVLAISGVFDLRPIQQCYVQEFVGLNDHEVATLSPQAIIQPSSTVVECVVGDGETSEFVRQTSDFASAWQSAGNVGGCAVLEGVNHLTILDELADPDGRVCRRAARLAERLHS